MKRTLCILLTLILVALCIPAVNAQTTGDKISPELRALIDANPDGGKENGVVVEVFHHNENYPTDGISEETAAIVQDNPKFPLTDEEKLAVENNLKAHAELIAQIGELTHMEPDGFAIGRCFIGLPYDAIDKVAALENVDYIDLPRDYGSTLSAQEKYTDRMATALKTHGHDSIVSLQITLAYTPHPYVGVAQAYDGCTVEEYLEYFYASQGAQKAHFIEKNSEYAEDIASVADVSNIKVSEYGTTLSLETKLSEVEKIASLSIVGKIEYMHPVKLADDESLIFAEKFEQWIYDTRGVKKFNYELSKSDPDYEYFNTYDNYDELYAADSWALVYATVNVYDPWEVVDHIRIGNRILSWYMPGAAVYPFGYFVYNAAEDTFYPIDRFVYSSDLSLDDYPGLVEALDALEIGRPVGDADGDSKLTILDATRIQRVKVGLDDTDEEADLYETGIGDTSGTVMSTWKSWSDADSDDKVTVLDATRIQRTIAKICTIDGTPIGEPQTDEAA